LYDNYLMGEKSCGCSSVRKIRELFGVVCEARLEKHCAKWGSDGEVGKGGSERGWPFRTTA